MSDLGDIFGDDEEVGAMDEHEFLHALWGQSRAQASLSYAFMQEVVEDIWPSKPEVFGQEGTTLTCKQVQAQEAAMIHDIVIGMTQRSFRTRYSVDHDDSIRDEMPVMLLRAYATIEDGNAVLIHAGVNRDKRRTTLEHALQRRFPLVAYFREVASLEWEYATLTGKHDRFMLTPPTQFFELSMDLALREWLSTETREKVFSMSRPFSMLQRKISVTNLISVAKHSHLDDEIADYCGEDD